MVALMGAPPSFRELASDSTHRTLTLPGTSVGLAIDLLTHSLTYLLTYRIWDLGWPRNRLTHSLTYLLTYLPYLGPRLASQST